MLVEPPWDLVHILSHNISIEMMHAYQIEIDVVKLQIL